MKEKSIHGNVFLFTLIVVAILLSVSTTYAQVNDVTFRFVKVQQEKVHTQMMNGVAGNPWQYRILSDWLISYLIRFMNSMGIPNPSASAFIAFRFMQCMLIFLFGGLYYRKLGLSLYANLIGLSILAWGMSHSLYNSDLSFNSFFDLAFYLAAAILIMDRKMIWIPLLMIPAAFNRETSILIPFMTIAFSLFHDDHADINKPALIYAITGFLLFLVIAVGLRLFYGEQQFLTADGYSPGIGLVILNLSRWATWEQLLITLGLIPFLALFAYPSWIRPLNIFFWVVVPVWFAVHFFAALVAESRLLLVPQALVFIPGMLLGLVNKAENDPLNINR